MATLKATSSKVETSDAKEFAPVVAKGSAAPRGYVDAKRYTDALGAVRTLKEKLSSIEEGLEASSKEMVNIEEVRRQEAETFAFNTAQSRKEQLAIFAEQDKAREAKFKEQQDELAEAQAELAELLGLTGDFDKKAVREAFQGKIAKAHDDGVAEAKKELAASYETKTAIDAAKASTELALLTQKVTTLEAAKQKLEETNTKLIDANQKLAEQNAEVAKTGLNAAAGVVSQGNQALNTAAGAIPGGSRTR